MATTSRNSQRQRALDENFEPYRGFKPPSLHADENLIEDLKALDRLWNPPPSKYENDPIGWVHNVLHSETWSLQREIYAAVNTHRYTAVKSCHGPGKSYTGAALICWWIACKPDPFVVTSAPTSHQVRTILWREIKRAKERPEPPLRGKITQGQVPEWKDPTGEILAFGRKPADYLDQQEAASAFQGIHAQSLLVVLDEGSGIPDWLASACENLITNEQSRLLIIGNPDNPVSYFARAFKPNSDFATISIPAHLTPNFTNEKHEISENLRARLTSEVWVAERKKRWGVHSPMYQSKVNAEFPTITDDTVFTPAHIAQAVSNELPSPQKEQTKKGAIAATDLLKPGSRLGMDVARLGSDETVIYQNFEGHTRLVGRWSKKDTMETVGAYRRLLNNGNTPTGSPPTVIDVNGLGAGIYDRLRELGYNVIPFNGGEKAYNPTKYRNRRSEAYWETRELFEQGAIDLEQGDEDLQAELLETHFKDTSTGLKAIEPKEDIAQRLGHSPDRADAFVMSHQRAASAQELREATSRKATRADKRHQDSQQDSRTQHTRTQIQIDDFGDPTNNQHPKDIVRDIMETEF